MKKHVKIYYDHFDLGEQDFVYDEYEYVVNDRKVRAVGIHHILFGKDKYDHIENLMALSQHNHTSAHREELKRDYLWGIHEKFLLTHPYY